jgi:hypothetical protein
MIDFMLTPEIQESHSQFLLFWEKMVQTMDTPEIGSVPGLKFIFGNVAIPFFNGVFLFDPVGGSGDLKQRLESALAFAESRKVPWFLFAWDDATPGDLRQHRDQLFGDAGLTPALTLTGMAAELPVAMGGPLPGDLELRSAENSGGYAAIGEINSLAY